MIRRSIYRTGLLIAAGWLFAGTQSSFAIDMTAKATPQVEPTLRAVSDADVLKQAIEWLKQQKVDAAKVAELEKAWSGENNSLDVLDRLARTLSQGDPRVASLVQFCSQPLAARTLPDDAWMNDVTISAFVRSNMRLYYGRYLAHSLLYDEAADQLRQVTPDAVVDPSALLFYQSVAFHRLLEKEPGLRALDRLLVDVADVPQRFRAVAALMKVDLQQLDDATLDHISRRMDDIRRRLDLGRAGEKVVKIEDGVIESLDKLIEEMEKQQQQQGGGSGSGGGNMRPSSPMQDSKIAKTKGPGEVDRKRIGDSAGWGDLPPKQREEAMQQIGKDFPAHYRDVIEQYFRRLASGAKE